MFKPIFLAFGAAVALSACGSTSTSINGIPSGDQVGTIPSGLTVAFDAAADTLTLTNGAASVVVPGTAPIPGSNFNYFSGTDTEALFGETVSGGGRVVVLFDDTQPMRGTITQRLTQTTLPSSGSATFTAEYNSFILAPGPGGLNVDSAIVGVAILQADFGTNSVGGTIGSRINLSTGSMADLTLAQTTIDANADFSGTASGGEALHVLSTTSGGTYSGQIVGANGTEIVGGVYIDHNDGTTNRIEIGGFFGGS